MLSLDSRYSIVLYVISDLFIQKVNQKNVRTERTKKRIECFQQWIEAVHMC